MSQLFTAPTAFLVALLTGVAVFILWFSARKRLLRDANHDADVQSRELIFAAKEQAHELIRGAEEETRTGRTQVTAREEDLADQTRALSERQSALDRTEESLRNREVALEEKERDVTEQTARYATLVTEQQRELNRVSGMTSDEAKERLLRQLETEARRDAANLVKKLEHEARETAADKAKHIIAQAIQRSAPEHAIETTVSVVDLPSDDLKGRIIGREGRNIRGAGGRHGGRVDH